MINETQIENDRPHLDGEGDSRPRRGVERTSMPEQIRSTILARISEAIYRPGDRLKQADLAREFNVSQGTVREALSELEALGVLESECYRGTRVRMLSDSELREVYQLRGILEQAAAELTGSVPQPDLEFLQKTVDAMVKAARKGDVTGYVRQNFEFHRRIVSLAGNQALLRSWESLAIGVRSHLTVARVTDHLAEVAASHQRIIDALKAGNAKLAGRQLREHADSFVPAPTK
jgi:DNA-binding GntR family transcriptional regulator